MTRHTGQGKDGGRGELVVGYWSAVGCRAGKGGELDAGDHVPSGLLAVDHQDEGTLHADQPELDVAGLGEHSYMTSTAGGGVQKADEGEVA